SAGGRPGRGWARPPRRCQAPPSGDDTRTGGTGESRGGTMKASGRRENESGGGRRLVLAGLGVVLAGAACAAAFVLWPTRPGPPPGGPPSRQWEVDPPVVTAALPTGNGWSDVVSAGARALNPGRMVWIPGGRFFMGESHERAFADARPVHEVELDGFWMDATEVTNAQFRRFVE